MGTEPAREVLYHYRSSVRIGEVERYVITYDLYDEEELPERIQLSSLWLKVKNVSSLTYRAAYLMGPYMLYCDLRTEDYHHSQKLFSSADMPQFEPAMQPQHEFLAELSLHRLQKRYVWLLDVVSQIIFTTNSVVPFEVTIASAKPALEDTATLAPQAGSFNRRLTVNRQTTLDLWNLPQQVFDDYTKPEHLVVLTHGLHSNVTADMQYLKETIEQCQQYYPNEHIVVKGFGDNVCKTEKGIKYLGGRLGEYIVKQLYNERIKRISFIGHSLGGLTQTFAIAYIAINYPWFFEKVDPVNFVALSSPLLGIVTNNPAYVNILLSMGVVGKTGQDLGLQAHQGDDQPLLCSLPGHTTRRILRKFKKRTLYANAVNDGIVPLYTSALLYLDYDSILKQLDTQEYQVDKQDFFTKTLINPLVKAINVLMPQTQSSSSIPKVSMFDSAMSVLLPPLPEKSYLMNPSGDPSVILHDKMYSEADIPEVGQPPEKNIWSSLLLNIGNNEEYKQLEEEIAKKWHKGMTWRKVIVHLKPDAHNNIIVRRRFANAYGWPVIDHLVQNHFNGSDYPYTEGETEEAALDELIEQEKKWINRPHNETFFDVGPTGMISSVGEILENIKNSAFQKTASASSLKPSDSFDDDEIFRLNGLY
ncbi:ADL285Cp [Eremothecium gossypii ATCC 10895]|uniref:ADL285Cp n=1 Tax=Eremothecium gossypii (strain ATCC 10895 / CBS 109.51 / FGSC 9923 / NRRL Y-1056) TaxID=284811 RepID=Q75B57_EREGS|nr:ADL285Cp [Eremothecium gossypii ATCC 10895]AAS51635.1 ADL285Cp [Eremothecium gossypii ATCC 10895]AEY95931.1 FADL285Cp [Eremothecium gossypii FDAG1]